MHGSGTTRVSVVVPTRNERRNIEPLLSGLDPGYEVVLSDGGSVDGTVEAARHVRPDCRVVTQGWSRGTSLLAGLQAARGELVVLLDADGSTCPSEVARMTAALTGDADVVRGSRVDRSSRRSLSDSALAAVASACLATTVTDPWCQVTAVRRSVVPRLGLPDLTRHGAEFELLLTSRAVAEGLVVREVAGVRAAQWHQPVAASSLAENTRVAKALFAARRRSTHPRTVPAPRTPLEGVVQEFPDRF
jgi:hypothetical protein